VSRTRLYNTEAVVVRKSDLGEADSIVVLYTPHLGKLRAVAKGARRPKSRIGGHVELLVHSQMLLVRTKSLDIISQSQTIDSFLALRDDLWRTSSAIYVAELIDRFTAEEQENYPLFRLFIDTLHQLCRSRHGDIVLRYFELHLLKHLGYQPELQQCLVCRTPITPGTNYFTPTGGGVVCPHCTSQEVIYPLSVNALKVLRFLQSSDYPEVDRLRTTPELASELERLMQRYIRYLLERDVKSAAWLDRLRNEEIGHPGT